jgi:ABC-type branched-subunit amino acid transport system ATPase component
MEGVAFALSARLGEAIQRFQEKEPDLSIFIAESDLNRVKLFTQNIYTIERGELVSGD